MSILRRRTVTMGVLVSLAVTVIGMSPTSAHSALPDPKRPAVAMPGTSGPSLKTVAAKPRGNHVAKATDADRRGFEKTGAKVATSEEGLLVLEVADDRGAPLYIAAYDTKTASGTDVVGIQFIDQAAIAAAGSGGGSLFAFGPQAVQAHRNGTNHWHNVGWPFHDNCSYVYNWANGDSTFHICPVDVGLLQYVSTGWGALLGGLFNPVVGFVVGLLIYQGWQNYKNADGSIDLFGPNASINTHYGYTYYWGTRGGWYWHYPSGSVYYGYARRDSTGVIYRTH